MVASDFLSGIRTPRLQDREIGRNAMGDSLSPIEEALSAGAAKPPETHADPSPPPTEESVDPAGGESPPPPEPGAPEGETGTADASEEGVETDLDALPEERPLGEVTEPDDFKPVFKSHPKLRDAWYAAEAYREVFGTVKEAQALRDALPEGMGSLTEMQESLDELSGLEDLFSSREEDGPDRFLSALHEKDESAYSVVSNANFRNHLTWHLQQAHSRDDQEWTEAIQVLWNRSPATQNSSFLGQDRPMGSGPQSDQRLRNLEVRERQLRDQELEHQQQSQAAFANRVQDDIDSQADEAIRSHLKVTIGKRTALSEGALNRMASEISDGVNERINGNAQIRRFVKQSVKSGDLGQKHASGLVETLVRRYRQLVPGVAAKVVKDWSDTVLNQNKTRVRERETQAERVDLGGGGSPGAQGVTGGQSPGAKEIDYHKTTNDMILRGEYVLKDGRKVQTQLGL